MQDAFSTFVNSPLDITMLKEERVLDIVDDPRFRSNDRDLIYEAYVDKFGLQVVPFGEYLRRYICRRWNLGSDYMEVPISEYQKLIKQEFTKNKTPHSFTPTTAKIGMTVRNWLTQTSVNRNIVLLLGFGLKMSYDEVNELLVKAIQESALDPKNPFEVICAYCYIHQFSYTKFLELKTAGKNRQDAILNGPLDSTMKLRGQVADIKTNDELFVYLLRIQNMNGDSKQSVSARMAFQKLYGESLEIAAEIRNESDEKDTEAKKSLLGNVLARLKPVQKVTAEQMGPSDIEDILLAAIPVDKNGDRKPMRMSTLNDVFQGKRLTRQRISSILAEKTPVTRFDLLTLFFFVYAYRKNPDLKPGIVYNQFIDESSKLLTSCNMGPFNISTPYESFLLMCSITVDPLGTYSDVFEKSYDLNVEF